MHYLIILILSIFLLSGCSIESKDKPINNNKDIMDQKDKQEKVDKMKKALTIYELIG